MFVDPDSVARRLTEAAPAFGAMREAYLAAGFNRQEALELVLAAQTTAIAGMADGQSPEA